MSVDLGNVNKPLSEPINWQEIKEQASIIVSSGMIPYQRVEQAITIMLMGREYGLGPMRSFQNIYFTGKALAVAPKLKLALARGSGLLQKMIIEDGEGFCKVTAIRKDDDTPYGVTYTMDEASKAGLLNKDNWKKYPKNMLRWRAMGYVLDISVPEVVGGLYTPDELGSETDEKGELISNSGYGINNNGDVVVASTGEVVSNPSPLVVVNHIPTVSDEKMSVIKGLWKETKSFGITEAEWREVVKNKWKVDSTSALSDSQLNQWKVMLADAYAHNDPRAYLNGFEESSPSVYDNMIPTSKFGSVDDAIKAAIEQVGTVFNTVDTNPDDLPDYRELEQADNVIPINRKYDV